MPLFYNLDKVSRWENVTAAEHVKSFMEIEEDLCTDWCLIKSSSSVKSTGTTRYKSMKL